MPFHSYKGFNLHYEIYGRGETALLFIHGLGGDYKSWKYQVEYFQDRFEIVTIDLFGHGLSSKDTDPIFVPRLDAEAVFDLMKHQIKKPYFAIGHSFASSILPEIIKLDERNLSGVVFVDCTYQGYSDIINVRVKLGENMLALSDKVLCHEAEYWYNSLIGAGARPDDRELIMSSFRKGNFRWMFESVTGCKLFNEQYPPEKTPIREKLPIFVMEGGKGVGFDFRKSWVNHFKDARYYLFEKAYHFFFITEHERFNELLEEFIEENR